MVRTATSTSLACLLAPARTHCVSCSTISAMQLGFSLALHAQYVSRLVASAGAGPTSHDQTFNLAEAESSVLKPSQVWGVYYLPELDWLNALRHPAFSLSCPVTHKFGEYLHTRKTLGKSWFGRWPPFELSSARRLQLQAMAS